MLSIQAKGPCKYQDRVLLHKYIKLLSIESGLDWNYEKGTFQLDPQKAESNFRIQVQVVSGKTCGLGLPLAIC